MKKTVKPFFRFFTTNWNTNSNLTWKEPRYWIQFSKKTGRKKTVLWLNSIENLTWKEPRDWLQFERPRDWIQFSKQTGRKKNRPLLNSNASTKLYRELNLKRTQRLTPVRSISLPMTRSEFEDLDKFLRRTLPEKTPEIESSLVSRPDGKKILKTLTNFWRELYLKRPQRLNPVL
jgi:hypothetical protein